MFSEDLLRPLTVGSKYRTRAVPFSLVIIYRINQTVSRDDFVSRGRNIFTIVSK